MGRRVTGLAEMVAAVGAACSGGHYSTDGVQGARPWDATSIACAVVMSVVLVGGLVVAPFAAAWHSRRRRRGQGAEPGGDGGPPT